MHLQLCKNTKNVGFCFLSGIGREVEIICRTKIAIIVSAPIVARVFLAHQINTLSESYDVYVITNLDGESHMLDNISDDVNMINLPIERDISLFKDLNALFLLILTLYKGRFFLVHSVSPKAGLLAAVAAWIARVPNRLHTFTGQVWSTRKGVGRWFLKFLDKIIVTLNTNILVDSFSQQEFLIKEGVLPKNLSIVLGRGSISGVDINRFLPSKSRRSVIRKKLNIENNCLIFLFVGRLKKEKGVFELVEAFKGVCSDHNNILLLLVGPDEDKVRQNLVQKLGLYKDLVRFVDFTKEPEYYMAASDVFVLPSYREGFGSVVIEAASCGLPSVGSDIYGLRDAIRHSETGVLVPVKSIKALKNAMSNLADSNELRNQMSKNARALALHHFSQNGITLEVLKLYKGLIKE